MATEEDDPQTPPPDERDDPEPFRTADGMPYVNPTAGAGNRLVNGNVFGAHGDATNAFGNIAGQPRQGPSTAPEIKAGAPDPRAEQIGNEGLIAAMRSRLDHAERLIADILPHLFSRDASESAGGAGALVRVNLTKTSGGAGNATTPVSFLYSFHSLSGLLLGTAAEPEWPRRDENGKRTQADKGSAYQNTLGVWVLCEAFEGEDTGLCGD